MPKTCNKTYQTVTFAAALTLVAFTANAQEIRTPAPAHAPRINGPRIYGERPTHPFLFTIPATGDTPITYTAKDLPPGLTLNQQTGQITGTATTPGTFQATLTATNAQGTDTKPLKIVIGNQIALTPPLGWNSWNCFAGAVDQNKVEAAAHAMVDKGLIKHGWTFINIDDTWQGKRTNPDHAPNGDEKFPDMKKLADDIHNLGLKAGLYSTPWITSYAQYPGGSSDNPDGTWNHPKNGSHEGKYPFMTADAKQFANWGFDYLKYDWNPITAAQTKEMTDALQNSGRDIVFSLSNSAPQKIAADLAKLSNSWRTTDDIIDTWHSMTANGFSQNSWAKFSGPGHWNDPDMLVVGYVGWGPQLHPTHLTADEQYTHITLWSLLASPLLIGCDMTKLDDFTLNLLTNDEVLAVDQDELGHQATRLSEDKENGTEIWSRPLADGTIAVGLFNRGRYEVLPPRDHDWQKMPADPAYKLHDRLTGQSTDYPNEAAAMAALAKLAAPAKVTVDFAKLGLPADQQPVRDLWRQKDLPPADGSVTAEVAFHGAELLKIGTPR